MTIPIITAALITIVAGWMIIKRYPVHIVLLASGLIIIGICILCGTTQFLPKGTKTTGFVWFDLIELINAITKKQVVGVGLIIMTCGGFAGYMSQIGAANRLVQLCAEPLRALSKPYFVLALAYLIGQGINLVVVSAAGLTMLLLVAFYPILVGVGVSRGAAAACIACCSAIAAGPLFGTQQLAAKVANVDSMAYFVEWQLPACWLAYIVTAVAIFFTAKYYDAKKVDIDDEVQEAKAPVARECPKWYAVLPFVPIVLLFVFSKFGIASIKLSTPSALMLTWIVVAIIELIRLRDAKLVMKDCLVFFKKMGALFGGVVALVICAEVFATGLRVSGLVSEIIGAAKGFGFGVGGMTCVLSGLVGIVTFLTGSGVGAFSAFANLSVDVQNQVGGNLPAMMVPMHLACSVFRSMSPVAGCLIAAALVAGVSPMSLVRRNWIPMCACFGTILLMNQFFNM